MFYYVTLIGKVFVPLLFVPLLFVPLLFVPLLFQYTDKVQCAFTQFRYLFNTRKNVGPCITYLGIEINANTRNIQLTPDKFMDLMIMLRLWTVKKSRENYSPSLEPCHLHVKSLNQVRCF